jgi:phytoene dehydrogenase-like protein
LHFKAAIAYFKNSHSGCATLLQAACRSSAGCRWGTLFKLLDAKRNALFLGVDVEVEHLTDPLDWQQQGMERGTPFALAHRFFQTGPFRPHLEDRRHPGVVFVGSGTIPGVGIPMVLISGKLAAARVEAMAGGRS